MKFLRSFSFVVACILISNGCKQSETVDFSKSSLAEVKAAAEKNNAAAQYELGKRFKNGQNVLQDSKLAVEWWQKSAAQKFPPAEYDLGMTVGKGDGVPKNQLEEFRLIQAAANSGYARAQQATGVFYFIGNTNARVQKDYQQAFRWFQMAANQDLRVSQYLLAVCYQNGKGTETNLAASTLWFERAASNGLVDAQVKLGSYYNDRAISEIEIRSNGPASSLSTNANFAQSVEWYQKAANQNCDAAQFGLGVAYSLGCGVEIDRSEGYKWFMLARSELWSNSVVKLLDKWKTDDHITFTPEQMADGRRLAEEFSKTNQTRAKLLPDLPGL